MFTHIKFFWRIAGEGIGAWQVCQVELIAKHGGMCLCGIDSYTRVVTHMSMGTGGKIKE